MVAFIIKTNF